jgi:uncharacterized protein YndB with AHSA1/START domain
VLKPEPMCFLIADISGYTEYLGGVELDHAQDILADLIGTVVTSLRPTFRLSKLEGDAAFTFTPAEQLDGSLLLDAVERCYFGFRRRRRDVRQATSCECDACVRIPDLDLKFVVHHGEAARQRMVGREELLGRDVILVHRLLKNTALERTGIPAYALITQACIDAAGVRPAELGMREHIERYDHIGDVRGWVHDLGRRWEEEEERTRVLVTPAQARFSAELRTPLPPQLVWEFLTTPGRRVTWQLGVTKVTLDARGNRRGVGAVNHCMHGEHAILEEILDWRPYDYFSYRTTMDTPVGRIRFLATWELEPTRDGTILRCRFAAPTSRKERELVEGIAPMFQEIMSASEASLRAALDAEVDSRGGERAPEPPLPRPAADSPFAAIRFLD